MWGASISVSPAHTTVVEGGAFSVDVVIGGVTNLFAYQFDVAFDPTMLQAVAVSEGAFLSLGGPTFFIPGTIDNINGAVWASAGSIQGTSGGASGSGVIATITFNAVMPGVSSIVAFNTLLLDPDFFTIDFTTTAGVVEVVGVPEPASLVLVLFGVGLLAALRTGSASK